VKTREAKTHGRIEKSSKTIKIENSRLRRIVDLMTEVDTNVNKSKLVLLENKTIMNMEQNIKIAKEMFSLEIQQMTEQIEIIKEIKKDRVEQRNREEEKKIREAVIELSKLSEINEEFKKVNGMDRPKIKDVIKSRIETMEALDEGDKDTIRNKVNENLIKDFNNKVDNLTKEELEDTLVLKQMFEDNSDSDDEITKENIQNRIEG